MISIVSFNFTAVACNELELNSVTSVRRELKMAGVGNGRAPAAQLQCLAQALSWSAAMPTDLELMIIMSCACRWTGALRRGQASRSPLRLALTANRDTCLASHEQITFEFSFLPGLCLP